MNRQERFYRDHCLQIEAIGRMLQEAGVRARECSICGERVIPVFANGIDACWGRRYIAVSIPIEGGKGKIVIWDTEAISKKEKDAHFLILDELWAMIEKTFPAIFEKLLDLSVKIVVGKGYIGKFGAMQHVMWALFHKPLFYENFLIPDLFKEVSNKLPSPKELKEAARERLKAFSVENIPFTKDSLDASSDVVKKFMYEAIYPVFRRIDIVMENYSYLIEVTVREGTFRVKSLNNPNINKILCNIHMDMRDTGVKECDLSFNRFGKIFSDDLREEYRVAEMFVPEYRSFIVRLLKRCKADIMMYVPEQELALSELDL